MQIFELPVVIPEPALTPMQTQPLDPVFTFMPAPDPTKVPVIAAKAAVPAPAW
jgi:hypothetical protein